MEYADIEAAAREQGWRVDRTKDGHRRLRPPDKTKRYNRPKRQYRERVLPRR